MARPRKSGIDYFPLDVDFFDDEKIVAISGEYGVTGEIVALRLLCTIYRNGYYMEWSEIARYRLMRLISGVSAELMDSIVESLVKWGLFDGDLFANHRVLTSRGIQQRYFLSIKKRTIDDDLPYLLITLPQKTVSAEETIVSTAKTSVSTDEMPQSKEKESKVKENKENKTIQEREISHSLTVAEEVNLLSADSKWCASLAAIYRMTPAKLQEYLTLFKAEQCGAVHTSIADARSHFARWLRKILSSGNVTLKTISDTTDQRKWQERKRQERLEEQKRIQAEKVSAADYLRSRGMDPNTSIARLILDQLPAS